MKEKAVQIPYETYKRLVDYLAAYGATDGWSMALLDELEQEKKVVELNLEELEKQEARNRFEKHFGEIVLGYASDTNNEVIDQDLAKACIDPHQ
jgi:hypothetical protein